MGVVVVPMKRIPPRTQWAIERLVTAAKSEGLVSVQLGFTRDETLVGHASIKDKDGNWSYFWCDDGNWYQQIEVV